MINVRSSVVENATGVVTLTKHRFVDFMRACKDNGNTQFDEVLNPAAGKAPCFVMTKPGTKDKVFVVLSKGVSELRKAGKLSDEALKTLFVIDGKNQAGESRWYLSRNGITSITIDEAINAAEQALAAVAKINASKLESLIS